MHSHNFHLTAVEHNSVKICFKFEKKCVFGKVLLNGTSHSSTYLC